MVSPFVPCCVDFSSMTSQTLGQLVRTQQIHAVIQLVLFD